MRLRGAACAMRDFKRSLRPRFHEFYNHCRSRALPLTGSLM